MLAQALSSAAEASGAGFGGSLASLLPGLAGVLIALGGVIAQIRKSSPENVTALRARVEAAETRATAAEARADELAHKIEDLQDKMLDQGALLYNAQARLVQRGLMTREELENPTSTVPDVSGPEARNAGASS